MTDILMNTRTWADAGDPTQTGSQDSNDITNDVNVAIQSLNDVLNTLGFIENTKNFITAMEEFGQGMEAALACVSVDLAVVASGVKAAATAFADLEVKLGSTFTQMEQQLSYFTNTASSITLPIPTAADLDALLALEGITSGSSGPGVHLSYPKLDPSIAVGGAGVLLLFLGVLALA